MIEFLQFAFAPALAGFSLLLCVVMLYWLVVIAGLLDIDFLNLEMDVDADADAGAAGEAAGGAFRAMLSFFYMGRVPVTVIVTIMVFSMWILAMSANRLINPQGRLLLGLPVALGVVVASSLVVRLLGWPFARLYALMHANPGQIEDVTGQMCVLLTGLEDGRTGQAQVQTRGAPVVVTVVAEPGHKLHRGCEAVIIEHRKQDNTYLVASANLDESLGSGTKTTN